MSSMLKKGIVPLLLLASACSNESGTDLRKAPVSGDTYLYISFSEGPNQGRNKYTVNDDPVGSMAMTFTAANNVSFFEARNLISEDGTRLISSLRRFTAGEMQEGENRASSWLPNNSKPMDCGRLEQRDDKNDHDYQTLYGTFLECQPTIVTMVSNWRELDDGVNKERLVRGSFKDTVAIQMAMDNEPFQNFKASMEVEFGVIERAKK